MKSPVKSSARLSASSWCLFDWANSAFGTVIITFVFSVYFARGIVGDQTQGSAWWGAAIGVSGFVVAVLAPVLGSVADHYGARKSWLAGFTLLCAAATAALWFAAPGLTSAGIVSVLALVVLANVGFELALVFANAMLPHLVPASHAGRLSGWGWGIGYIGGLACLALTLFGLVGLGDAAPWLDLPRDQSEHIRAAAPLTALWIVVFTLPLLLFTHDSGRTGLRLADAVDKGLRQLVAACRDARRHGNLLRYLVASALYRDGLNTLFAVGGLFAAGTFGMDFQEILLFGIGLNVAAGIGAAAFAFLDDHRGSKMTIMMALAALVALGGAIVFIEDKNMFMAAALALGLFIGPAQAASRTLAARLSPPGMAGQIFGLYAFTGKAVAFAGPLAFAAATAIFDSQRAGMATILVFWLAGMALLAGVREHGR